MRAEQVASHSIHTLLNQQKSFSGLEFDRKILSKGIDIAEKILRGKELLIRNAQWGLSLEREPNERTIKVGWISIHESFKERGILFSISYSSEHHNPCPAHIFSDTEIEIVD